MLSVLSQAWHSWTNAKGIALLAVPALAIGIGSTTAIYTVVNGVMLAPLPYPDSDRFLVLYSGRLSEPNQVGASSAVDLLEYQQRTHSFDVFGWFRQHELDLTSPGDPQHVEVLAVTPSLAHNLGVQPLMGRWFTDASGAVLSYNLWRRLGADANFIGQSVTLSGRSYTVTGVMPSRFLLPLPGPGTEGFDSDVWISLDPFGGTEREQGWFIAYARRKPDVTPAQAEADVRVAAAEIARQNPVSHPSYTAHVRGLRAAAVEGIRPTLLLLFAAAALLLLITCANVAGLLLTRSIARARETATRVALGASQRQLAWQYFVEGMVLALAGSAAGVLVSLALVRIMVSIAGEYIPITSEIALDSNVLLFGVATAVVGSAVPALAPLWQAMRTPPNEVLNAGVRSSAGVRARRLSRALVIAEVVLGFTLLAVSIVLISHLQTLRRTSPGFDANQLLTFQLTMPDAVASNDQARDAYQARLLEALRAIPGVTGAAFANQLPLDGCCLGTTLYPDGRPGDPDSVERVAFVTASVGFVEALRIPLRSGRLLDARDTDEKLVNVVINEATSAKYWPGENPIEARGRLGNPDKGPPIRVVGVVGDVRNDGLGKPPVPEVYLLSAITTVNPMGFVVRSPLSTEQLVPEVRRAIRSADPTLAVDEIATMSETIRNSLVLERAGSFVMAFFAVAALLMASLGIYGVVAYGVRQRRVEIGTRMAVGAVKRDVLRLVVGGGLKMAVIGVVIGSVAVLGTAFLLARFFDVYELGLLPFVASTAIVGTVAALASSVPAWRATLLSPMVAIRDEPQSTWETTRQTVRSVIAGIGGALSRDDEQNLPSEEAVLTEFVAAARQAQSSAEVVQTALATLTGALRADWAVLAETSADKSSYVCSATTIAGAECSIPADGFLLSRLRASSSPLAMEEVDFQALIAWANEHRPQRLVELVMLQKMGARLAAALRTKNEVLGVLVFGAPSSRDAYTAVEKRVLGRAADQFALIVENARLTDRVVEQEKLRRDVALAVEVQRRLLPEHPPAARVAAITATSVPARSVGGDYYDFIEIGDNRIGLALADVAGKGVAAALIMAAVQASLRVIASEDGIPLPQLVAKMNRFLYQSTSSASYATFFYAQLDERTRQLRYVNAGHNPPYLVRAVAHTADQQSPALSIEELKTGGAVIGLLPHLSYEEATIDLQPGDVLIAFTDGVVEALNTNEEEFGEERLKDLIRRVAHLPVQEISTRISEELRRWISHAAQYDDLTFLVMKVNE